MLLGLLFAASLCTSNGFSNSGMALISRSERMQRYPRRGHRRQPNILSLSSSNNDIQQNPEEDKLDDLLSSNQLKEATKQLMSHGLSISISEQRFNDIFNAIEVRTLEAEENNINKRISEDAKINLASLEYPPISPARLEMTQMYNLLKSLGHLKVFGVAGDENYPAKGSNIVTPTLLEKVTELSMGSLTPEPTNTLIIAGAALMVTELIVSVSTGISLNFLVFSTLFLAFFDKLLVNGAVFETAMKTIMPEYRRKILRHEAGHFLCAYLLGCPVEGCVLSAWAALADARFGGKQTTVSAGTSFFDPDLSDGINGRKPLSRSSLDRFSIIVMGGIAAEAINFGNADGGAGDEMALVSFLTNLNPKGGDSIRWNTQSIKNQARWGILQAVLLLKEYRVCYEALVDALERGGELGRCVYAIEKAAAENGLKAQNLPIGYVLDQGAYGEWTTSMKENDDDSRIKEVSSKPSTTESTVASLQDEVQSLLELKKAMQKKLDAIDNELDDLDNK